MRIAQGVSVQRTGLPSRSALRVACVARPQRCASKLSMVKATATESKQIDWTLPTVALLAPFFMQVNESMAKGGELGILEGRSAALLHPIVMGSLFVASLYSAYLGYQWKRTREIVDEVRDMKRMLPAMVGDVRPPSPLDAQIVAKEAERKVLLEGKHKDKHFAMGSILLASGVGIAIEGAANTYVRTGKLFPGPHLYAGMVIVSLWAFAAALVPEMQKGNQTARNLHIGSNIIQIGLFAWQLPTGWEIVEKVFQFTSWP
ncbi:MAG: hypothetical protein WDW36_008622 [Sanguina aurantia]